MSNSSSSSTSTPGTSIVLFFIRGESRLIARANFLSAKTWFKLLGIGICTLPSGAPEIEILVSGPLDSTKK